MTLAALQLAASTFVDLYAAVQDVCCIIQLVCCRLKVIDYTVERERKKEGKARAKRKRKKTQVGNHTACNVVFRICFSLFIHTNCAAHLQIYV